MGAVSCLPDQAIVEGALSVVWKLASGCPANCLLFEQLEEAGQGEDDVDGVSELIVMAMGWAAARCMPRSWRCELWDFQRGDAPPTLPHCG